MVLPQSNSSMTQTIVLALADSLPIRDLFLIMIEN